MWAQLVVSTVKPGSDLAPVFGELQAAEQPDSGLIRSLLMRDQRDPSRLYSLVLFGSEEQARERERDPRRADRLKVVSSMLAELLTAPPEFVDLEVVEEFVG